MPRKYTRIDHVAAFWSKVDTSGDCWLWQGRRDADGYGRFGIWGRGDLRTNRYVWEITHGPIPDDLWVLHKCDNPACVRPDHLFLGTVLDNNADMLAKGRQVGQRLVQDPDPEWRGDPTHDNRRGEKHGEAKLTEDAVREIRRRRAEGEILRVLAAEFGVSDGLVRAVVYRRAWRHVA